MQRLLLLELLLRWSVSIVATSLQASLEILVGEIGFVETLSRGGVHPLPLLLSRPLPLSIIGHVSSQLQAILPFHAPSPSLNKSLLYILIFLPLFLLSQPSLLLFPPPPPPLLLFFLFPPPHRRGEMPPLIEVEASRRTHWRCSENILVILFWN